MPTLLKLTDYETGMPVYIDPSCIYAMARLPEHRHDDSDFDDELGAEDDEAPAHGCGHGSKDDGFCKERTRVEYSPDGVELVDETPEAIINAIGSLVRVIAVHKEVR